MKKLLFVLMLLIAQISFGQTVVKNLLDARKSVKVTGIVRVNNDTITDQKIQAWDSTYFNTVQINTLAPMLADSGNTYVTPYQLSQIQPAGGGSDSISVLSETPATGNIYISSADNRIHYKSGVTWYRLAVQDSIAAITQGIVSYWKLDETTGSVLDALGDNPGTTENTPTTNVAGKLETCYTFASASSENIGMGTSSTLRPTAGLTVSFWIKTSTTDNGQIVSTYGLTGTDPYYAWGYEAGMIANGYIYFDTYQGSNGSGCGVNTTDNIANNAWHFVVCTYDNINAKIYIDGALSATSSTGSGQMYYQASDFVVAARSGGGNYYNGSLDEIGVWSRALTAAEVTILYNTGTGKTYPF